MRTEGDKAEKWAQQYLENLGYKILSNNFCVRGGEIDIVARRPDGRLVFFEIKMRRRMPEDHRSVLPRLKIIRLQRAAHNFLCAYKKVVRWQIDLLLLVPLVTQKKMRVVWYRNIGLQQ